MCLCDKEGNSDVNEEIQGLENLASASWLDMKILEMRKAVWEKSKVTNRREREVLIESEKDDFHFSLALALALLTKEAITRPSACHTHFSKREF